RRPVAAGRAPLTLRQSSLGSRLPLARVRLPARDRGLQARPRARVRLLRPAAAAARPHRRARRPQARARGEAPRREGVPSRARRPRQPFRLPRRVPRPAGAGDRGRGHRLFLMEFETRAIHDGQEPDPATGAITTPIYQTSTYVQDAVGEHKGYDYSRVANPTRTALQEAIASLEGADHGIAFSSGLGATTTLMHLVDPGQRVVLIADVYGGVYRMTSQVYAPKGYRFTYVPPEEFDDRLASFLDEDVAMVWVETPSNPLLNVVDIRRAADDAHAVGRVLVVAKPFRPPH